MMTGRLLTIFEIPRIEAGAWTSLAACGWSHCWPWNRHLVTRSHSPPGPTPDPPETVPEILCRSQFTTPPLASRLQTSWSYEQSHPLILLNVWEKSEKCILGAFSPTDLKAWNVDSKGWNFSISCQVGLWVRPVCVYYRFKNPAASL